MSAQDMKKLSKTNWAKIKAMKDSDINFSDIPELDDNFFAGAKLWPGKKKQITLRLDPDVIEFFKAGGGVIRAISMPLSDGTWRCISAA